MDLKLRHAVGDDILGHLQVVAVVGSGAFGTVYRCVHRPSDGVRAVKELHLRGSELETAEALRYFRREAEHLARLDHPGIPHAEAVDVAGPHRIDPRTGLETDDPDADVVLVDARHYLVMDWVEGESLAAILAASRRQRQRLPAEPVLDWVRQLGATLDYLHAEGLVHRDVKPANVLVRSRDGRAMLLDFGLCRAACSVSGYGTVPLSESGRLGTPGYAPPDPVEQENPGPASDQHALGITAREALTGLDPSRPDELEELRRTPLVELRPDLSPHVAAALDRAVSADPAQRHATLRDLVMAFEPLRVPLAAPVPAAWIEILPPAVDLGRVAPGHWRDTTLTIRDRRGDHPVGDAVSDDQRGWLKFMPGSPHGSEVALHLVVKVPRRAVPMRVETSVTIRANEEKHVVPVSYTVDPDAPQPWAGTGGCLLAPLTILAAGWR